MIKPIKITFLHPDLGIGGAERLVVDAALALKTSGYEVNIVTSHHDPSHCFEETKDGTLPVTVAGDWLPRSIFGRFYALCAYLRMIYASFYLIFFSGIKPDLIICDQVSVCIPIVHITVKNVLFYCHFPDQLLSSQGSKLKSIYRLFIDWLEEKTTSCADKILVNSKFTQMIFKNTYKNINDTPDILYPSINTEYFDSEKPIDIKKICKDLPQDGIFILSINRYERKKDLGLAIEALYMLKNRVKNCSYEKIHLIVAGGYDTRVNENVEYYDELVKLAKGLDLSHKVHFLKSPSDSEKLSLLMNCKLLVYTPPNEHFGIVPLEAMYAKKPVVAVNSGGPRETVSHYVTGLLCEFPIKELFADAIAYVLDNESEAIVMGNKGRERFDQLFSFNAFKNRLESMVKDMLNKDKTD